ncbi:MAG: hypothetical protein Q8L14_26615 [Myxococcales bacterium]|nr:hypothetical protein [Myxococcales bacterium]
MPVAVVALGVLLVAGVVFVMAARVAARKREAFLATCSSLGATVLAGSTPACVLERAGLRLVLMRVERRDQLPPRVDVLLEAALSLVPAGGVLLRENDKPAHHGPPDAALKLEAALTLQVRAVVTQRLGGRLSLRSLDTIVPDAAFRVLLRSRWTDEWRGMLLQTWLPLGASTAELESAVAGLLEVRAALVSSPGVEERGRG